MKILGQLEFPGDKSISHRAVMLAALTNGDCIIKNISTADDVESTQQCLHACGIISKKSGSTITITGGTLKLPDHPLDCGNSGTTARLLTGLLAGQGISATLKGDQSLSQRPMDRIIRPLKLMGVAIDSDHGHLPIKLKLNSISGIEYTLPVASAQVKSSILLAGLGAREPTTVIEKTKTRDHTEIMLKNLGADLHIKDDHLTVSRLKSPLKPFCMTVPGDPSTAAFFAAGAALLNDSELILKRVLANPTRNAFYDTLQQMGAGIERLNLYEECGELVSDLKITHQPLKSITISGADIPRIIDELPILAVLATQAEGTTIVNNAEELRVKESDRIKAICTNLNRMGASITELEDGFIITGPTPLHGNLVTTFNDHRIAMAFSIAGLISQGSTQIDNIDCIRISCPEFEDLLGTVTQ